MSHVFTDFVRSLDPQGTPRDNVAFAQMWTALRQALRRELARRGLLAGSPQLLGIDGSEKWPDHDPPLADAHLAGSRDALDELAIDAYVFIFVQRLRSLRAHLDLKSNIEGLVFLNVYNFLQELQRKHDPLGYRVYIVLADALNRALEAGQVHLLATGEVRHGGEEKPGERKKLNNDDVFGFHEAMRLDVAREVDLGPIARAWNDKVMPELIIARGDDREKLIDDLVGLVAKLPGEGVEAFRFKDLIDPLKKDARTRWSLFAASEEGETAPDVDDDEDDDRVKVVRLIRPDDSFEQREYFEALAECTEKALERHPGRRRTRQYLLDLWRFLRTFIRDQAEDEPFPSYRGLAQILNIPRNRLPELFKVIGGELAKCRKSAATLPAPTAAVARSRVADGSPLQETLLKMSLEALRGTSPEAAPDDVGGTVHVFPKRPEDTMERPERTEPGHLAKQPWWQRAEVWLGLVASVLLVVSLSLLNRQGRLATELDKLRREAAQQVDLDDLAGLPFAWMTELKVRGDETERTLPDGVSGIFVILELPDDEAADVLYRLEVVDDYSKDVVHVVDGLQRSGPSNLTLLLPREAVEPSRYILYLYRQGETEGYVSRYGLTLKAP